MVTCFNQISVDSKCRSVVFSGAGKVFSAGQRLFIVILLWELLHFLL